MDMFKSHAKLKGKKTADTNKKLQKTIIQYIVFTSLLYFHDRITSGTLAFLQVALSPRLVSEIVSI